MRDVLRSRDCIRNNGYIVVTIDEELNCVLRILKISMQPKNECEEKKDSNSLLTGGNCSTTSCSNSCAASLLLHNCKALGSTCPPSAHLFKVNRNNQAVSNRKLSKGSGDKMSKVAWHTLVLFLVGACPATWCRFTPQRS
jgi:hypothetical protein